MIEAPWYVNPVTQEKKWLAMRKGGIGGSAAGTLMRWNDQYSSVTRMWKEMCGFQESDFTESIYTFWGSHHEPTIIAAYARHHGVPMLGRTLEGWPVIFWPTLKPPTHLWYRKRAETRLEWWWLTRWLNPLRSPVRSWARCNVDSYELDPKTLRPVRQVEVKTTIDSNKPKWTGDAQPAKYLAQVVHNREVLKELGLHIPYTLTCLVGGCHWGWGHYDLHDHAELRDELLKRELQFMYCVENREKPPVNQWFPTGFAKPGEDDEESMPFPKPNRGPNLPPCPAGTKQGIVVDYVDLGEETFSFQGKEKTQPKIRVGVMIPAHNYPMEVDGEPISDKIAGKPYVVWEKFTYSLDERGNFYKFLYGLRGRGLNDAEEAALRAGTLEPQDLVPFGTNGLFTITHRESKKEPGRFFANISTAAPLMDGMAELQAPNYVRVQDRDKEGETAATPAPVAAPAGASLDGNAPDDELPF